ncbi:MAG: outer membrane protein assembly factor BamB family protein [Promethearchaeota archaeon]|jgi:outer membrane protein assembly factor BamB
MNDIPSYKIKNIWKFKPKYIESGGGPVSISYSEKNLIGIFRHKIYFINIHGELLWKVKMGKSIFGIYDTAISNDDSFIVISGFDKNIICLDYHGNIIWKEKIKHSGGPIHISEDSSLIFYGSKNNLYLVDKSGKPLWEKELDSRVLDTSILLKSQMLLACTSKKTYCYNSSGELNWEIPIKGIMMRAGISMRGDFTVVSNFNNVYSINNEGSIEWTKKFEGMPTFVKIYNENNIMILEFINKIPHNQHIVHFINKDGKVIWIKDMSSNTKYFDEINRIDLSSSGRYIITKNPIRVNCFEVTKN